ncbi:hypothetical protein ACP70R_033398 [Stipagrostis hirtigluma subsp. patula]
MEIEGPMPRGQPRVLQAMDAERTQSYHFLACAIAGMGFFTDAYDLFSISLVIIAQCGGLRRLHVTAAITSIALFGTVPGALIFGWLGDKIGRKRIYGVTLILMVVSSLASALSFSEGTGNRVVTVCFFRFWLGFGIGGDYPLSATIMSEYSNTRRRGAFMAAIFAMQGFGILVAGFVTMIVWLAFKDDPSCKADDYIWRIVLMIGAVPAAFTYYFRMKMPETARFTALIAHDENRASSDMSTVFDFHMVPEDHAVNELARQDQYGLFSKEFLQRHGIHLIGTTVCWLLVDITFYSLNLFLTDTDDTDDNKEVKRLTIIKILEVTGITLVGTLPGYFFSVALADRIGRIKIQFLGFTMMSFLTAGLATLYYHGIRRWLEAVYAFTLFFANFGPNTTTFIIPAEIFPARLRSTCHGISTAVGKIGAIIGVFGFLYKRKQMLFALIGCNVFGIIFTFFLPESKGKSLEEITGEMEEQQHQDGAQPADTEFVFTPIEV